jgi:hypothetical protein
VCMSVGAFQKIWYEKLNEFWIFQTKEICIMEFSKVLSWEPFIDVLTHHYRTIIYPNSDVLSSLSLSLSLTLTLSQTRFTLVFFVAIPAGYN